MCILVIEIDCVDVWVVGISKEFVDYLYVFDEIGVLVGIGIVVLFYVLFFSLVYGCIYFGFGGSDLFEIKFVFEGIGECWIGGFVEVEKLCLCIIGGWFDVVCCLGECCGLFVYDEWYGWIDG